MFRNRKIELLFLFCLSVFVCILYGRFAYNDFISDDKLVIVQNTQIGNLKWALFSSPFTFLRNFEYFLIYTFFKLSPVVYHLLNIFFHVGTLVVFFVLLRKLSYSFLFSMVAVSLFALHPVHAEAVGWISGGPYPQYTFYLLLSFLFFTGNNVRATTLSILFFVLALFSSHMALVFPIIIFMYLISFEKKPYLTKVARIYILPEIIFVIYYLSQLTTRITTTQASGLIENVLVNPLTIFPLQLTSYFHMLLWPQKLSFYHTDFNLSIQAQIVRICVIGLFFIVLIISYKKNKRIFFWLTFFLIGLIPTMLPVMISWIVAERYVYFSSIGFFVVCAYALTYLLKKITIPFGRILICVSLCIIFSIYILRGQIRLNDWKNADTLWLATAKTDYRAPQNHNNLGDLYARRGNFQKAKEEFKIAILLKPTYADAYHNLGLIYIHLKDYTNAMYSFRNALRLNPNIWQSHQNIALLYFREKNFIDAQKHIQEGLKINPENKNLKQNLQQIQDVLKQNENY